MAGSGKQIYFYNYFDPEQNTFADLSVFEFDADRWVLGRWTFAPRVVRDQQDWKFENGWTRSISEGEPGEYRAFTELRFDRAMDGPDYFKREVRIASQMNYPELRDHIDELRRAGFEVGRLTVELYGKLSFPLAPLIMAMIAIPFALSTGRRGAFYGIGIAIGIGIGYWAASELFGKLGGMSQISPAIAAWFPNLIFGFGGVWMLLKVRT
jgi:lipopolysaccharide export LptBFGC system permease protein LptF